ncbi:MAG: CRISPR-associated protein Csm7 [Candidatus Accumulibacter sp.]|jgi:CRISPR-associated protein Csm4|nr:CRISPR-associated protein Csm7 [Accumulibacter sp.]
MQPLRFTLRPQTAFGTPLAGDTLFGQLCWALRRRWGNDWLAGRLAGYTNGRPFLVVSDAFPRGFLPLPAMPGDYWAKDETADRKALKKKRWLPLKDIASPFADWQSLAHDDAKAAGTVLEKHGAAAGKTLSQTARPQPHNTINRATGTTGEGMFSPYGMTQIWFHPEMRLDLYAAIDETRITAEELAAVLEDMGRSGYGRDASIGLGKFTIERDAAFTGFSPVGNANAFLTLAPCAPQGLGFDAQKSFYQPLTRFGRHGDVAVHSGNPFKRPLLLAKTGGVFTPGDGKIDGALHIGQGLNGLSTSRPEAVAQGYAPVIGIRVEHPQ